MDERLFEELMASVREGGEILRDRRKRAICRAAAEISGLTGPVAEQALYGLVAGDCAFPDEIDALRRFAELAREET